MLSGSHILLEKLRKFKPKIAVFNGKLIYEVFSGKKEFGFGRQPSLVDGTDTVRLYTLFFTDKTHNILPNTEKQNRKRKEKFKNKMRSNFNYGI